ncbi:response regulator [Salidesulfovibrio brasiliensis]|uniref:response regulator n=1 Tax=Salidesulfovibrio brasiliensis TaxID=221711 RepID=UPI0006D0A41A|nr:response regulator [Salidesulfovibrio brasiliensis]
MNQRPNVLLVDDQKLTHAVIEKALREMDLNLISAFSGDEALRVVRSREVSLVLMDLMMPGMNGIEAATRIREELAPTLVPVIFITAASQDEEAVRQAYEMGAVDFLYKPISPTILKAKVGVFAELHRQRMALEQRKEEYRDIIEAVATGIITLDMDWRVVEANDSACVQFLQDRDSLLGKGLSSILGRDGEDLSAEIASHLDSSVGFSVQSIGHRSDGTTFRAASGAPPSCCRGHPASSCVSPMSRPTGTSPSPRRSSAAPSIRTTAADSTTCAKPSADTSRLHLRKTPAALRRRPSRLSPKAFWKIFPVRYTSRTPTAFSLAATAP